MNTVRKKLFSIIQLGNRDNIVSLSFDIFIVIIIFLNLTATVLSTYNSMEPHMKTLEAIEFVTVVIFTVEYILRFWTADLLYPMDSKPKALFHFFFSFNGIVDLLSFLPYWLPIAFPMGIVAFRCFRVARIFRLFKISAQYDAFNVILDILKEKRDQLLSSIVMILILMLSASLCMYSLENEAQPELFENAFSGIWWAASSLLTVGYGDIYPITIPGKILGIIISFLGVGMVAIPTGIISAGFVEQYTKINERVHRAEEHAMNFIAVKVEKNHPWRGKKVLEAMFPPQFLLVLIIRNDEEIVPRGDTLIQTNDIMVLAAVSEIEHPEFDLKEIVIKEENPWIGHPIRDLDISRQELIVLVERAGKSVIPNGSTVIRQNDVVMMYSKRTEENM